MVIQIFDYLGVHALGCRNQQTTSIEAQEISKFISTKFVAAMPLSPCPHDQLKPVNAAAIFDRTSLTLARTERLIKSWFPSPPAANAIIAQGQTGSGKEEPEDDEKVEECFAVEPELLGLGAKASEAQKAKDERAMVDERLRRQIMGKDWQKKTKAKEKVNNSPRTMVPKVKNTDTNGKEQGEEEEEEEGRSSLGRKRKMAREAWHSGDEGKELETSRLRSTKRATYLDEVLSTRNHKKRKKRHVP